jgi:NTE family protein
VLEALALSSTDYATGQSIVWCQGRSVDPWERPARRAVRATLRVEHVLASAALPMFFPAIEIDGSWYGDGGVRLATPLAPALHLGAGRILAVSTRHRPTPSEASRPATLSYPPPAQVLGVLYDAIFLDLLDQDALTLRRINALVERLPPEEREGLRKVELLVLRPSRDLGRLANEYEPRLPGLFRFMTRRLGTRETRNQDFLSLLMFQRDYLEAMMALGEADAAAREAELAEFLAD